MSFSINLGNWNSVFAVPSCVVDKHIKLAGGAQLKVLLWILRHSGEPFTTEDIGRALSMHPADVHDSMQYWIETGLICRQEEQFSPPERRAASLEQPSAVAPVHNTPVAAEKPSVAPVRLSRPLSRPQKPDSAHVAKRLEEDSDLAAMLQEAQMILGKTISPGDCATLLMLHDNDGLPVDVILMLLQYAVGIGKGAMRYIEKVGISWAEEGIDSHYKAEQKIRALDLTQKAWRQVENILGIEHRSPSSKEAEAANRWVNEWKFSPEMLRLAYERCVDTKGKYYTGYMDGILKRFHAQGIVTVQQAEEERRNNPSAGGGGLQEQHTPSYDIEAYERSSIFDDITPKRKEN